MKAFFLAAGEGTRLRPLTNEIPKCLAPIRGVPLLGIWLQLFRKYGITEVLVNLHWKSELVRDYVRRAASGMRIRLVEEPSLLGTAGTLAANRDWAADEKAFWIIYGDVITNTDLSRMWQFHLNRLAECTIGVVRVTDPEQCGVAALDASQRVIDFQEKPERPQGNWVFAGIAVAGASFFDLLPRTTPTDLGRDVFPRMAGRLFGYPVPGYFGDIGTMEKYRKVESEWEGIDDRWPFPPNSS